MFYEYFYHLNLRSSRTSLEFFIRIIVFALCIMFALIIHVSIFANSMFLIFYFNHVDTWVGRGGGPRAPARLPLAMSHEPFTINNRLSHELFDYILYVSGIRYQV